MKKPAAEKPRNIELKLPSGTRVSMDSMGRIIDPEGDGKDVAVTAKDLDAIVKRALFFKAATQAPKAPDRVGNASAYDVKVIEYDGQENSEDKPGDVYIGCEHVPLKLLKRVHALSTSLRSAAGREHRREQ